MTAKRRAPRRWFEEEEEAMAVLYAVRTEATAASLVDCGGGCCWVEEGCCGLLLLLRCSRKVGFVAVNASQRVRDVDDGDDDGLMRFHAATHASRKP